MTAPDDTTVVIQCTRPKADILSMWVPILPEHIWSQFKTYDEATNYLNKPPIVGSGPFQVVEWQKGKFVRAVANKHYWGGAQGRRTLLRGLHEPGHAGDRTSSSAPSTSPINIPPAQVTALKGDGALAAEACSQKPFDYLSFNCYQGPSLGNPVLRDVKFRQALNWAVDKDKLTALAYQTYADPGTSIFEVNFYDPDLDWHWQPPADVKYKYDPTKAKQAAVRRRLQGHRWRRDPERPQERRQEHQAAPLVAHPVAAEPGRGQAHHRLVEGPRPRHRVLGRGQGVLFDGGYNYVGKTYKPDYDIYIWAWQPSGSDPGRRLGYFRTADRESERRCWSNKQYDDLWQQQSQGTRPAEAQGDRLPDAGDPLPRVALHRPRVPQAPGGMEHPEWEGWKRIPQPNGAVAFISDNVSNYYKVGPMAAEPRRPRRLEHGADHHRRRGV